MKVKKIVTLGVLLAIMLVFQLMKSVSVYITGPVVNFVLIVVTYYFGLTSGLAFSVIAPLTSYFITPNPILIKMPLIVVFIALGNATLCLFVHLLKKRNMVLNFFVASTAKAILMGVSISLIIIPMFGPATGLADMALSTAKITFSIRQLLTAYIGSIVSIIAIKYIHLEK